MKCAYSFERRSALNAGKNNPMFGRRGKKSPVWKGDTLQYSYQHRWLRVKYGKPRDCELCGKVGKLHNGRWNIHYCNKSGEYLRAREDWLTLCVKCHWAYDKERRLLARQRII